MKTTFHYKTMFFLIVSSLLISAGQISSDPEVDLEQKRRATSPVMPANATDCSGDPLDQIAGIFSRGEDAILEQAPQLTETQEEQMGDSLHNLLSDSLAIITGTKESALIQTLLNKLLPYRERTSINYDIYLIDSEQINAFSLIGGHIYITSGLLEFVESEDELAMIVGHEIGHVDKKHCTRKMQKILLSQRFLGDLGDQVAMLNLVLTAPFRQVDEYECDRIGAYLSHSAGYNPRKGKDFFIRLKELETYDMLGKMVRTHPFSEQREKCLEQYIAENLD